MYYISEGTLTLRCNVLNSQSWWKKLVNQIRPSYGWKRNGWKTAAWKYCTELLFSSQKFNSEFNKDCLTMLYMLMGSVPPFLKDLFQNDFVHLYNCFWGHQTYAIPIPCLKLLLKNCMQNMHHTFSWPCFKFSSVGALCNFCTQTPKFWRWGSQRVLAFPYFIEILLPFSKKYKNVSSSTEH